MTADPHHLAQRDGAAARRDRHASQAVHAERKRWSARTATLPVVADVVARRLLPPTSMFSACAMS
jgi:hypothetical protein